ncbi:MAG: hypothetical protein J6X36_00410 [Lachnospiraceae bacterium]|nr:hypothetical protein [Lachnospiraceae bacterium]
MIYQDLQFHLSRIEGVKEGLLSGQFPVMMQSVWMSGKGYPVSIFYGDAPLYIPAILRILGVKVIPAYKIFVLLVNILTATSAVISFKKIVKNDIAAYVGALLYVTASYRYVDIYVRAAAGEYVSFIFFPIIALAMYRILFDNEENDDIFKNSFLLALGMTGLIESHILSTVMTVFLLTIVCIFFIKRTFTKKSLLTIGAAVIETVMINLYFIVPFIDYYINEPVYAGRGGDHTQAMLIRSSGAYLSQFIDFFGQIFGRNIEYKELRMQLTIGLPLTIALLVCLVVFLVKQRKYPYFVIGFMAMLTLFMSTDRFPWNTLEGRTHLFKILAKVQFPWRYLAAAILFTSLIAALMLKEAAKSKVVISVAAVSLCIVMTVVFAVKYKQGYESVNFKEYSEVDSGYMGACEYLKEGSELEVIEYVPTNPQLESYEVKSFKDNKIVMYVSNPGEESYVEVPKVNYKGYYAYDENKNPLTIRNGYLNLIDVVVPAGFEGEITVNFKQPFYWIISTVISFLSLAFLCFTAVKRKRIAN